MDSGDYEGYSPKICRVSQHGGTSWENSVKLN